MSRLRSSYDFAFIVRFLIFVVIPNFHLLLLKNDDRCAYSWYAYGQSMSVCDETVVPINVDSGDNNDIVEGTTIGLPYDVFSVRLSPCLDDLINSNVPTAYHSVIGNGGRLRASTCSPITDFNHRISVYAANDEGDCSVNECVNSSIEPDESCTSGDDAVSIEWNTYNGWEYYVLIQNQMANTSGTFGLSVDTIKPANDQCRNAQNLEELTLLNSTQTTVGATQLTLDPCNRGATSSDLIYGVWYYVIGGGDDRVDDTVDKQADTDDSSNSTLLVSICSQDVKLNVSIFTSSDTNSNGYGGSCGLLDCHQSSIQSTRFANTCENGIPTEVAWDAISNEKYYIFVYSQDQNDDGGPSSIDGAAFDILFTRVENITIEEILDIGDDGSSKNDGNNNKSSASDKPIHSDILLGTMIIGLTVSIVSCLV